MATLPEARNAVCSIYGTEVWQLAEWHNKKTVDSLLRNVWLCPYWPSIYWSKQGRKGELPTWSFQPDYISGLVELCFKVFGSEDTWPHILCLATVCWMLSDAAKSRKRSAKQREGRRWEWFFSEASVWGRNECAALHAGTSQFTRDVRSNEIGHTSVDENAIHFLKVCIQHTDMFWRPKYQTGGCIPP